MARTLEGLEPVLPKNDARFHFSLEGSVQGFQAEDSAEVRGTVEVGNEQSRLALRFQRVATGRSARVATHTFIPRELLDYQTGYVLVASPTLYPGQTVRAALKADENNPVPVRCNLYLSRYDEMDDVQLVRAPRSILVPGKELEISWTVPDLDGYPVAEIGIELTSELRADGTLFVDYLTWDGVPTATFQPTKGTLWGKAWAKAIERFEYERDGYEHLAHNEGVGMLIQGCREWQDYRFSAAITPKMMVSCGLGIRVQGLRRYYAFLMCNDKTVKLVKALDGIVVLAQAAFAWESFAEYQINFEAEGSRLRAWIDGRLVFDVLDEGYSLEGGAVALMCEEGCMGAREPSIRPIR